MAIASSQLQTSPVCAEGDNGLMKLAEQHLLQKHAVLQHVKVAVLRIPKLDTLLTPAARRACSVV